MKCCFWWIPLDEVRIMSFKRLFQARDLVTNVSNVSPWQPVFASYHKSQLGQVADHWKLNKFTKHFVQRLPSSNKVKMKVDIRSYSNGEISFDGWSIRPTHSHPKSRKRDDGPNNVSNHGHRSTPSQISKASCISLEDELNQSINTTQNAIRAATTAFGPSVKQFYPQP